MGRPPPPTPPPAPAPSGSGVDPWTLALTAAASALAAYVTSKIWAPGTLASAAFTPVLVALAKEALARPAQVVARTVPTPIAPRAARRQDLPDDYATRLEDGAPPPAPPPEPDAPAGPITYHKAEPSSWTGRLHWRAALVAGLLGFAISALAFTVPELIAGDAVSGGRSTTLFGGHRDKSRNKSTTDTTTTTQPSRTVTAPARTVTVPAPTETVPAPETTTPTQTAPPETVPPTTTTAPPTTTTVPPPP